MKKLLLLVMAFAIGGWAVPKPMESIENYNVLMVHGAYGSEKGFENNASDYLTDSVKVRFLKSLEETNPQLYAEYLTYPKTVITNPGIRGNKSQFVITPDMWLKQHFPELFDVIDSVQDDFKQSYDISSAYDRKAFLGGATLGRYGSEDRITNWLSKNVFEEEGWEDSVYVRYSYIYNWRSFSNPANSSHNNAYELADRTWNKGNKPFHQGGFGHRRALMEEAQEVKAEYTYFDKSLNKEVSLYGQDALDSMRLYPDLYHQLASRYILIGHSMGGVVSREYVQGNFYNGDVDKIITLDSPHEGTGALNMLIDKSMRDEALLDQAINNLIPAASLATGISLAIFSAQSPGSAIMYGIMSLALVWGIEELGDLATSKFAPEHYYYDDPLVHYVDPKQNGFQTIDSLNHLSYENKIDSLPMFRILASQHGMTFSDPESVFPDKLGGIRYLIPDNFIFPFANYWKQLLGTGDKSACHVNALVTAVVGLAGMPMQENGSSIVPAASSEGRNVSVLNDNRVNVKREYFNGAPAASGDVVEFFNGFTSAADLSFILEAAASAMLVLDLFKLGGTATSTACKIALGVGTALTVAPFMASIFPTGIYDLAKSHSIPLQKNYLDDMKVAKKSFSTIGENASEYDEPYLMEDFLYEKPFVNLALFDSRTADSLAKNPSASLNPSCYYGVDGGDDAHLCEIGLYGEREPLSKIDTVCDRLGNVIGIDTTLVYNAVNQKGDSVYYGSFKKDDFSAFKKGQFRFKAESDWYKVGVKMDRWEKVDGLTPGGELAPKSVPIRHVERYNLPNITVDNWIEKYSFVVDDLMPHRLRQIKLNFNFKEEIAWECDITKPVDADDACAVYKRSGGGEWKLAKSVGKKGRVPHPVSKNGRFEFAPKDYGMSYLSVQKDNQNTVMITMVNKIEVA